MKKLTIKVLALFVAGALTFQGCNWVDPDLNLTPNSPTDVNMPDLLPLIQVSAAYTKGGDLSRFSVIPMQHLSGVNRQSFAFERYNINESDINNLWLNFYAGTLKNASILLEKAEELNSPHYAGIAKVMMAYALGSMAAVWGDIPYSTALQGDEGNLNPTYDSQEQIYQSVISLLNGAIADFGQPAGSLAPSAADLMFKGSAAKWSAAAAGLKARFTLHLSKRNGYGDVLSALSGAIASNDGNLKFTFGNNANEWNPIYQFDQQREDIRVAAKIVDMMNATLDPRRSAYFEQDANGDYVGSEPGEGNLDASMVGPHYASTNSPVYFITYAEVKFIEAEAKMQTGDAAGAADAYNEGVKASLAQHGASDAAWELIHASETALTISLQKIMEAKYIALFTDSEVWADWRRTGIPTLTIAPNPATNDIPRRFPYPLNERLYNGGNMPAGLDQDDRVWWDN